MARFSQTFLQGLLNPAYQQGLFEAAKGLGQTPGIMRLQQQQEKQKKKLADIYSTAMQPGATSAQLLEAARQLSAAGKTQEALALADQARELRQTEAAQSQIQQRQEAIAESARKLGLTELAERAMRTTDEESLRAIQKDIRDFEIKEIVRTRGIPGRKALAKNAGIDFEDYMEDLSPEAFVKVLEGEEATLKAFIGSDGNEIMLEVDNQGRVKDPNTGQKARASELGLRSAPNRQQVENIANFTNEKLAEAGVARYDELATAANDATTMINNITEVMPNLDDMIAGRFANAELFVRQTKQALAGVFGLSPNDPRLENTEVFAALAAPRVATIIKDYGAGTGLSDTDREFATLAAGGDITQQAASLRKILTYLKTDAENTLKLFDDITEDIRKDGGTDPLIFYRIPVLKSSPVTQQQSLDASSTTGLPPLPPGATLDS